MLKLNNMKLFLASAVILLISACNNSESQKAKNTEPTPQTVKDTAVFRATGNEPGWLLEIKGDEQIRYVGNYGQDSVIFPYTSPVVQGDTVLTFSTAVKTDSSQHVLIAHFEKTPCTDDGDQAHGYKVRLQVNDKALQGCGDKLK